MFGPLLLEQSMGKDLQVVCVNPACWIMSPAPFCIFIEGSDASAHTQKSRAVCLLLLFAYMFKRAAGHSEVERIPFKQWHVQKLTLLPVIFEP